MICNEVQPELVAFHFGEVSEAERDDLEAHLLTCSACVAELLALKRAIEMADGQERPSSLARSRLRRAMAAELAAKPRPWSWWERPLAASVAAAAVAVAVLATQAVASSEGAAPRSLSLGGQPLSAPAVEQR